MSLVANLAFWMIPIRSSSSASSSLNLISIDSSITVRALSLSTLSFPLAYRALSYAYITLTAIFIVSGFSLLYLMQSVKVRNILSKKVVSKLFTFTNYFLMIAVSRCQDESSSKASLSSIRFRSLFPTIRYFVSSSASL